MQNPIHLPPSAATIHEALLGAVDELDPLYELLRAIDNVFLLAQHLPLHPEHKALFESMKIQCDIFSNMVVLAASSEES